MGSPTRAALIGAAIAGGFGGLWAVWAASGLDGTAHGVLVALGIVLGLAVVVPAVVLARRAPSGDRGDGSLFTSRAYRVIVAAEVVAIVVGNVLLGRFGLGAFVIAWTAFVVGVHFLAFGRAFAQVFTTIGVFMIAGAGLGLIVGLVGLGDARILLVTGIVSAVVLLGAGARTVLAAHLVWP
ncbi:hypothetical protein LQ327_30660 [Actinomycetospora endophytica]|uniref:Uncharacterized protein n=1 Tax=Actinomycetospora endophytica TaxID=2291215 RepID=A0ABS8PJZ2_9PSEU|nr:hypothetical protein [Actinomycetospora endophytica]MCD2197741.1 hypothetical protein [Actinomycetospora endophytica]